jgi:Ca2+-binding RTX toxin-like protein
VREEAEEEALMPHRLAAAVLVAATGLFAAPALAQADVFVDRNGVNLTVFGVESATVSVSYTASTGAGDPPDFTVFVNPPVQIDPGANCSSTAVNNVSCTDPDGTVDQLFLFSGPGPGVSLNGGVSNTLVPNDKRVTYFGGPGNDSFAGGAGDDTFSGGEGTNSLDGREGDDVLTGGTGVDTLTGGAGDDLFAGSPVDEPDGADRYIGGSHGTGGGQNGSTGDTVTYEDRQDAIIADIDGAPDDGGGGCPALSGCEDDEIESDVENVIGGSEDDQLVGNAISNRLTGGPGDDSLLGSSSASADGADVFDGGDGDHDRVLYSPRADDITAGVGFLNSGASGENDQVLDTVEDLVGGQGDDDLRGDDGPNVLNGGPGDDEFGGLFGSEIPDGADIIQGGDTGPLGGPDKTTGGGNSNFSFGDIVSYQARLDDVFARIGAGSSGAGGCPGPGCEGDSIDGEVEILRGGLGDDTLIGDGDRNELFGQNGDDLLIGGQGTGPDGADFFLGGAHGPGGDTISYASRADAIIADLRPIGGFGSMNGAGPGCFTANPIELCEGDVIFGSDIENLTGGSGPDRLIGGDTASVIIGGLGADGLFGRGGPDRIEARDGVGDTIECGDDGDTAVVDAGGIDANTGCETLEAPPPALTPPTAAPAAPKKCKKGQKRKRVKGKVKCVKKRRKRA